MVNKPCIAADSLPNGTNEGEAHPKFWTAILVQMNTEKSVGERLNRLGVTNYIATQTQIHRWSDRRKKIDKVVIPMVVFVHIDKKTEKFLRSLSFIYKFISYPGAKEAAVIPDSQINDLKFMLNNSDNDVEINPSALTPGDKVEIVRGPLKGLVGELCYVTNEKPMVAIRIECLGYACVNVSKADIEKVNNQGSGNNK